MLGPEAALAAAYALVALRRADDARAVLAVLLAHDPPDWGSGAARRPSFLASVARLEVHAIFARTNFGFATTNNPNSVDSHWIFLATSLFQATKEGIAEQAAKLSASELTSI